MTVRRVLVGVAVLLAVGGFTILLLPFDTTFPAPSIAGQPPQAVEVACKGPLVDLVTGEPDDQWLNYTPDEGVSYDSGGPAGGEDCAAESGPRGLVGVGLVTAAVAVAIVAVVAGRRGRAAPASPEPEADRAPTDQTGTGSDLDSDLGEEGSPAPDDD